MPTLNAEASLARAVTSVRAQTRGDWELVIADDGSSDRTPALARQMAADDPRIRVLDAPETGPHGAAAARNRAIAVARGRYLAFLDADDEWLPDKLALQLGWMETEGLALTYTGFWRQQGDRRREIRVPARVDRQRLLHGNVIGVLTAICDRDQLGPVAMPLLPLRQDYALWLDLLKRTEAAHGLQEPLAVYHVTPGSLSANRWKATRGTWRMYRNHAGVGRLAAAWYLASHLLKRLARG
ncbi:MAG: glycosyltransferase family 2 protein [Rhodobacteraceae bacterium]|nr:MAG: glycosyltransferase family 2 protein [Paracoccaceae bacterium]